MDKIPHSAELEDLLLGSVLVSPFTLGRITAELGPDDFYRQNARQLFVAMIELEQANVEINQLTLIHHLDSASVRYADAGYICGLTLGLPELRSPAPLIAKLKALTASRNLLRLASSITNQIADVDPIELLDTAEHSLADIRRRIGSVSKSFREMSAIDVEAGEQIENLHKGLSTAIPTGYKTLDRATRGGNQPGDVWVVASLTGRGKSSWALGAARMQAVAGIPVGIVSREMSDFENYCRMLSAASGVPMWRIKPGMYPDTYYCLQEWRPFTSTLPIAINSQTANIFEIRSQVKELAREGKIKSLFVDYLQLLGVSPETKMSSRAQEVSTVSRVLKEIAMENQIAVFALAQFNRYAAHGERPEIHHLAESSGIEKDASVVLILDMPEQKEGETDRECDMRIAKHRNGPCLTLKYRYRGDILTFEEAA